ncbi:MAG: redoxin domain-containing protein [Candidatus Baltobacteraceae bacterium]
MPAIAEKGLVFLYRAVVFAFAALLGASPAAGAYGPGPALTGPQLGAPAPAFSLRTIDGKNVSLDQFRGRTLVLNVWATWCPPCRQEMPELVEGYARYSKRGVAFLGVDTTEDAPLVRAFAVAKGLPYPQAVDPDKRFSAAYDIGAFPTTYVIDARGNIRARYVDVLGPAQLAEFVAAAGAGRNARLVSPLQLKIDAILRDGTISFDGGAAASIANAKRADAAIEQAESLLAQSDPAKGNPADYLRTKTEEAALRDRAIAALEAAASNDPDKALAARLRGDAATDREQWSAALDGYEAALALDAKDKLSLEGIAYAAGRLGNYDAAIEADRRLAALDPNDVDARVDLGRAYGRAKRFDRAREAFAAAIALGERHLAARPRDRAALRKVAWVHLYAGRVDASAGDNGRARAEFGQVLSLAEKLPAGDERHDMYLEEAQEATVALGLGASGSGASLSLAPWTGADLPGSIPNTLKYRLVVAGTAGNKVALHAAGVPKGWIASFCSDRLCAPFKTSVAIPPSGVKVIEFQLVPPGARADPGKVRVIGNDGRHTATAST